MMTIMNTSLFTPTHLRWPDNARYSRAIQREWHDGTLRSSGGRKDGKNTKPLRQITTTSKKAELVTCERWMHPRDARHSRARCNALRATLLSDVCLVCDDDDLES